MTDVTRNTSAGAQDGSTAELVRQAAEQISRLVRDELALARAEMTEKGKKTGVGAGLLGGGGLVALYGVAALLTAIVLGLAEAMPAWLAALIVAVLLFAVAVPLHELVTRTQYDFVAVNAGVVYDALFVPTGVVVVPLAPSNHW